jgi:hypothetical protein
LLSKNGITVNVTPRTVTPAPAPNSAGQ